MGHASKARESGRNYGLPAGAVRVSAQYQYRDTDGAWRWLGEFENIPGAANKSEGLMTRAWQGGGNAGNRIPDDTFTVRIQSRALDASNAVVEADTVHVKAPAVDPMATSVAARRAGDTIVVDWVARTNARSQQRIAATFPSVAEIGGAGATLFVPTASVAWNARRAVMINFKRFQTAAGVTIRVTDEELAGAIEFRIDSRQGSTGAWRIGAKTAKLAPKT